MAVGLKINKKKLDKIDKFLVKKFDSYHDNFFEKKNILWQWNFCESNKQRFFR